MVDTSSGTSTSPYTAEQDAKTAAILKERREKEAKKKALIEEQAAKMRKIEEEMAREKERLKREEEAKLEAVEEEEEEEQPLERRRAGGRGEPSGTKEDLVENKITEWVAGLSLGEDEEALMYMPREEQEAVVKEWDVEEDPLKRDSARELATQVGSKVRTRLEGTERYCTGAIEGARLTAPKEEEARPRREPVKVKFPDSYNRKEENFDNWEANVKTYVHLQKVSPDEHVLIAIHALKEEVASFAGSLVRVANCNDDLVAYYAFTPLTDFLKLLRKRFADVSRSVKASDRLQTIHSRQWSAKALKGVMDELVAVPDHGVTETQLVNLFYQAMPESLCGHFFKKSQQPTMTYDTLSREVVAFEARSIRQLLGYVGRYEGSAAGRGRKGEVGSRTEGGMEVGGQVVIGLRKDAPAFARLVKKEQLEEQVFVAYVRPVTEPKEEKPIDPAIAKLLEEFTGLAKPPTGVVPRPIQHRIEIEPGSRTPKGAVYRMSPRELEELRKQLDELLEKGWIRPNSPPFGAPVLFVPKKEATFSTPASIQKWGPKLDVCILKLTQISSNKDINRNEQVVSNPKTGKPSVKVRLFMVTAAIEVFPPTGINVTSGFPYVQRFIEG
ncbi:hypothetical protein CBR_g24446 [Chara braunii]|uniref:Reverse transcriptase domain-containing protein n=1 Tax=Chara braunii TaxID=69332 RepID=A0A388JMY0_CHABU|nr:hypothetical protein CBR_g24446 [Chara braunii]|eukprot:GBG59103.1 hypothetical protein CBR_g24446 [Chara braunii]